ncbi:phage tail tip lysozyme [Roseomonas sp. USHLN139]|uniref:phage tail tip lysozyme n=1 Tax=Roseomonas sp. USHLN139 TaxID=3081298 RepID=UPI003B023CB9
MSGTTTAGGPLSFRITALDRFTGPIDRMKKSAVGLQQGIGRLTSSLSAATRGISTIVPPLAALTAAGSIAGVVALADRWGNFATRLATSAYRVQTTVGQLHALQGAARLAGVSAESLTAGLEGLGDALVDAVGGRDSTALQYLTMLGVQLRDSAGNARTAASALPEVADAIARISDPRLQARVMGALRLPADLLPFLRRGSAGLREYEAEARRFGVVTAQAADVAQRWAKAQVTLKLAGEGLVNTISERLAPVLIPLATRLADWIGANRELIGQRVEGVVTRIAGAVERFLADGGLQRLAEGMENFGKGISRVVDWMGGWENAAIALGVVLAANVVAPLASITASLVSIAAFRVPAWMIRLLGLGGAAAVGLGAAGALALSRLGDQRDNSPEKQAEQRRNMAERGRAQGFYGAPPVDPGGDDAESILDRLRNLLRAQMTPGYRASAGQQRFGARGAAAPGAAPSYTNEQATERQREAFAFFRQQGWTAAQAAGIVANLRHESGAGLNHQARGDGGNAYGIAQWHPDRQRNFRLWSGKDIRESSLQDQLGFVEWELRNTERRAGDALRGATTAGDAASIVSRLYERPARRDAEAAARASTAEGLLPRLSTPGTAAPAGSGRGQQVDVRVRLEGLPSGVSATTTTRTAEGVRVERSSVGTGP